MERFVEADWRADLMNIREKQEQTEMELLSPYATQSIRTKGRKKPEVECEIRTCFQRDRDRIVHCKAFRRLKDKTQVFLSPVGDHYRTRLMHTLEVSQNARTIARALDLNETLTEAIALGHDLGHTPFGHAGERVLNEMNPAGFKHNEQSVRVAQCLEKNGQGLNLTWEVLDGMKNHSMHSMPHTLEGKIVRLADKIAYINHDIDDSVRAKVLREEDLPKEFTEVLGTTYRERINTMVLDIVKHSENLNDIVMSKEVRDAMIGLRKFMFERVYEEPNTKKEEDKIKNIIGPLYEYYLIHVEQLPEYNKKMIGLRKFMFERVYEEPNTKKEEDKIKNIIGPLYEYYLIHVEQLPEYNKKMIDKPGDVPVAVCDYIAGMTDHFAIEKYTEIFIPKFFMQK